VYNIFIAAEDELHIKPTWPNTCYTDASLDLNSWPVFECLDIIIFTVLDRFREQGFFILL